MKSSNSQERINRLLKYYDITQAELCKKTGLTKSTVSQFVNGKRVPRQDSISKIEDAFDIEPGWLLGYDIPMLKCHFEVDEPSDSLGRMMDYFKELSPENQEIATKYLEFLKAQQDIEGK